MRSPVVRSIPLVLAITIAHAAAASAQSADTTQRAAPSPPTAAVPIPPAPPAVDPATVTPAAAPAESAPPVDAPAPAAAVIPGVSTGDTVWLRSSAGRYAGTVFRVTADTVVIASHGRSDAVVRSDVTEMYRLAGRGSRGKAMLRGGGLGLVGGAALGLLAGLAVGRVDCEADDNGCTPGEHNKTIGVALTVDGALIGALLGVMTGPAFRRTQWERVDAAPGTAVALPSVSVAPAAGGGVSLGATLKL